MSFIKNLIKYEVNNELRKYNELKDFEFGYIEYPSSNNSGDDTYISLSCGHVIIYYDENQDEKYKVYHSESEEEAIRDSLYSAIKALAEIEMEWRIKLYVDRRMEEYRNENESNV